MEALIELGWQAWATVAVILAMFVALAKEVARPDLTLLVALGALLGLGVLSPEDAFAGFSNSAPLAVGALFVVAAGVHNTGALGFADRLLFSRSDKLPVVLGRMMGATAGLSAFLNNTPIVAMLIPRIQAWSEETGIPASKLMMPLSFAAILGGMTTLIGTSTNLLVSGLMESSGYGGLGMFDLTPVAVPAALCGIAYFSLVGYRLLPDRQEQQPTLERELEDCLFEAHVPAGSPLIGKTVEAAGFRSLGEAYLAHLYRSDAEEQALQEESKPTPVTPETVFQSGDVLGFVGSPERLNVLLERPGLRRPLVQPAGDDLVTLPLYEAVVAPSSELVGKTLREAGFREQYGGVVLGIHRQGGKLEGPLGRVPIKAGDLLLVEARLAFGERWRRRRDEFYLVAARRGEEIKTQPRKAPLALLILLSVITLAVVDMAPIEVTAFIGALAMIGTGCLPVREAWRTVDLQVLLVIVAALGLGRAMETTGLAQVIAGAITGSAPMLGPIGVVAAVYIGTSLLTELITNNAAAALMLPVGLATTGGTLGIPPEAVAVAVALAASASFLTPIGYQTNLMVMAPGGYRFADYLRSGAMINLVIMGAVLTMIWALWL